MGEFANLAIVFSQSQGALNNRLWKRAKYRAANQSIGAPAKWTPCSHFIALYRFLLLFIRSREAQASFVPRQQQLAWILKKL